MRTIKASEVVKGMWVRVEQVKLGGVQVWTSGVVRSDPSLSAERDVQCVVGDATVLTLRPDHPVTVLAEPEPEWVEGAWYWTEVRHKAGRTLRKRGEDGWLCAGEDDHDFRFNDAAITVLGRVLIVDWPGDDVARTWLEDYRPSTVGTHWVNPVNVAAQALADAIRTQGGAR